MITTDAVRVNERLQTAWRAIPRLALATLATNMIIRFTDYTVGDLRNTIANDIFRANSGRGHRYHFGQSYFQFSSLLPNYALISIEIQHITQ